MKNNTLTIEDVHHDINVAYLATTQYVNDICDKDKPADNKLALYKLGFIKYQAEIDQNIEQVRAFEIKEEILRFKVDYPYHKFITYEELSKIIDRYNLILSIPERFIGDIPEKNIKDILRFRLKDIDVLDVEWPEDRQKGIGFTQRCVPFDSGIITVDGTLVHMDNYLSWFGRALETQSKNVLSLFGKEFIDHYVYTNRFKAFFYNRNILFQITQSIHTRSYYIHAVCSVDKSIPLDILPFKPYVFDETQSLHSVEMKKSNQDINLILATQDQFMLNKGECFLNGSIMNIDFESTFPFLLDDPIVMTPVKHGFLIKTMWGLEAMLDETKDNNLN